MDLFSLKAFQGVCSHYFGKIAAGRAWWATENSTQPWPCWWPMGGLAEEVRPPMTSLSYLARWARGLEVKCWAQILGLFLETWMCGTMGVVGPSPKSLILNPNLSLCDFAEQHWRNNTGFCLIRYFCGGECNVHSPRFTSGATIADLLAAGVQLVTSPHACAEVGLGSDSNMQPHEQKTNALPLCQRPGFHWRNLTWAPCGNAGSASDNASEVQWIRS